MAKNEFDLKSLSDSMADAVEKAAASVLLVNARRRMPASGIAFAADLVLTANHVVHADEGIKVMLPDGSELSAEVVGRDSGSDLCLLKLDQESATPAELAEDPKPGQLAFALGRPSDEGIQASFGVVSAISGTARTRTGSVLESHIRTDAIPYPGFSGGPLIDAEGKILGINTSGLGRGNSIAIPVKLAWKIAASLRDHGSVKRGFLGIRSQPVEIPASAQKALKRDHAGGLLLVGVEADSPAQGAELMVSDILVGFNGQPVQTPDDLLGLLTGEVVGNPTPVEILRGGEPKTLKVTLGERA
ncbi:MAG: S1C family serine protease, partial [Chloroflexota bacterium]